MDAGYRDRSSGTQSSVGQRLDSCLAAEQILSPKGLPLQVNVYNLSNTRFSPADLRDPELQTLIVNYANQLLLPLFQESALYRRVNTRGDNKPRYNMSVAEGEVAKYAGATDELSDRVYMFLTAPGGERRFSNLIGYVEGYELQQGQLESLFRDRFVPRSQGTSSDDRLEMNMPIDQLEKPDARYIYYDGVGVAEPYHGQGLGLVLMSKLLDECCEKEYTHMITRVIRGAANWNLFDGVNGDPATSIPTTQTVARYYNSAFNAQTYYRAVFTTEVAAAQQYLRAVLTKKGITIEKRKR